MNKFILCVFMVMLNVSIMFADINNQLNLLNQTVDLAKQYGYKEPTIEIYVDYISNDASFVVIEDGKCIGAEIIGTLDESYDLDVLKLKAINLKLKYAQMFYNSKKNKDEKVIFWNKVKTHIEGI